MISKELFIECINNLQAVDYFQNKVCDLITELNHSRKCDFSDLGAMMYPDCTNALFRVLEEIMGDTENQWIGYFCYELDFGKRFEDGCVTDDGKDIPLATAEDLWNLLVSNN